MKPQLLEVTIINIIFTSVEEWVKKPSEELNMKSNPWRDKYTYSRTIDVEMAIPPNPPLVSKELQSFVDFHKTMTLRGIGKDAEKEARNSQEKTAKVELYLKL